MSQPPPTPPASTRAQAAAPAPAVAISNLGVNLGGNDLFREFNAVFPGGEWTCILGLSGGGKSTLLRHIAGLGAGGKGSVTGGGQSIAGRVAWMDQRDLLLPWLSASENVQLGARLRRERSDPARARALLKDVGLGGSEDARPAALSGGMRQRVALARTLMEDRPVVLMDEPFSAVDAITRGRLQFLAARLLRGRTVVLVTHDPWEALRLGHRIHVLGGRPADLGDTFVPLGDPPRDPADPSFSPLVSNLLALLEANSL